MSTKHGQFPEKETNLFTITFPRKTLELRNLHIVKALVSRLNETEIIWRGQFCWSAKIKGVLSPLVCSKFVNFLVRSILPPKNKYWSGRYRWRPEKIDRAQSTRGFQQTRESYRLRFLMKSGFSKHSGSKFQRTIFGIFSRVCWKLKKKGAFV